LLGISFFLSFFLSLSLSLFLSLSPSLSLTNSLSYLSSCMCLSLSLTNTHTRTPLLLLLVTRFAIAFVTRPGLFVVTWQIQSAPSPRHHTGEEPPDRKFEANAKRHAYMKRN
jgi:hypothetical protein